nr:ABC transporter substrate-binding protein [Pararobbsia silviterrae]
MFVVLMLACGLARAQATQTIDASTPEGLVKGLTAEVMAAVKSDKAVQGGNLDHITQLVNETILPYTDIERTTRLVMGRNWNKATPEQQTQIVEQFKKLLIRTYSGAIAQIHDQQVTFQPLRGASDTDAVVRTQVLNQGQTIELDYRLEKTANGWKVYDINVLGAWLIQAYQSQFNEKITQSGIDGLLDFLTHFNASPARGQS